MNRDATGLRLQHTHSFVFIYKNAFTILQTITSLEQVTDRAAIAVDGVDSAVQGKDNPAVTYCRDRRCYTNRALTKPEPVSTVSCTHSFSLPQFS